MMDLPNFATDYWVFLFGIYFWVTSRGLPYAVFHCISCSYPPVRIAFRSASVNGASSSH